MLVNQTIKAYEMLHFVIHNNSIPFSKQWFLQTNQRLFDCCNIQSHSLETSCAFLVQISKFSLYSLQKNKHREITFYAHTNYLYNKNKQSITLWYLSIEYRFCFIEIRYFIKATINTHIDCSNYSNSFVSALSIATLHGAWVPLHHFLLSLSECLDKLRRNNTLFSLQIFPESSIPNCLLKLLLTWFETLQL